MKILHIITTINRGGAENQIIQMISEQKKSNLDISIIFLKGNGYWKRYLKNKDILCFGPVFEKGNYLSINCLLKFKKILSDNNFNIIHAHMPPSLFVLCLSKIFLLNFSKIVFTAHNDERFINIPFIEKIFTSFLLKNVDSLICISSSVKLFFKERYKFEEKKIKVIPYGFDQQFYKKQKKLRKNELSYIDNNKIYIGTTARLVSQKRLDLLIKAFSILRKKGNDKFRLVILGNGHLKSKLLKLAISENVNESVIWIPYTENVISHMQNWDLFCLTSQYEGFGLVLLEAIYAQIPILAMNSSSIKDIVGPCGEIVEFGNTSSFADNILKIIKNKNTYLNKNYLDNFSFENNIIDHLKIYKSKI